MPDQQGLSDIDRQYLDKKVTYTCAVLLTLLVGGLISVEFRTGWRALGAAFLWAFASYSAGLIGGFLFAVPRSGNSEHTQTTVVPKPTGSPASATAGSSSSATADSTSSPQSGHVGDASSVTSNQVSGLGVNTNLVEISDWLTKMIVGIGLVQLKQSPSYVRRIGAYVGSSLGQPNMDSTGASLVIYFACLGFLTSYLLTRLFFSPLFQMADRAMQFGTNLAQEALAKATMAIKASTGATREALLSGHISEALQLLPSPGPTAGTYPTWRYDQLIAALSSYRQEFPLNRRLYIVLARLYRYRNGDYTTAIAVLKEFVANKKMALQEDNDVSDALFNIACYNSLLMAKSTDPAALKSFEEDGANAMRESIRINHGNLEGFLQDDDLKTLRESDRGKAIATEFGPKPASPQTTQTPEN